MKTREELEKTLSDKLKGYNLISFNLDPNETIGFVLDCKCPTCGNTDESAEYMYQYNYTRYMPCEHSHEGLPNKA